ncbi:MAG: hypothetical protein JSS09_00885 [Verrucomicrobia bacterium]|nr:hypothetical protein [Verrucomicrobiota bacterium]
MEQILFINPFFEEELLSSSKSIEEYLTKHPVYLQLHYLSCVLADPSEIALLLFPPEEEYFEELKRLGIEPPDVVFLKNCLQKKYTISSWGSSLLLADFAKERNCLYKIPNWDLVKRVNGKDFSFSISPKLPFAELLTSEEEIAKWVCTIKGPKVLKTLYGASGRGHCILYKENELELAIEFFRKEKARSCSILAEPWVERILDFSSQWYIKEEGMIYYLGSTICENSPRGIYRKSLVGPEDLLFKEHQEFLKEHLYYAKKTLEHMKLLGFFGPVGFDAMLYNHPETKKLQLHPIVEINARRTMGWAALKLYEKLKLEGVFSFSYELKKTGKKSFLPHYAKSEKQKKISLPGQLVMERMFP